MDDILTEFVSRTQSDAALAHDLLEAAGWNLDTALSMYDGFMNTQAVQPEDQIRELLSLHSYMYIQLNLSNSDTNGAEESVLVTHFRG